MATQTKTRKFDNTDVVVEWNGVTAPEITVPDTTYAWTLKVVINNVVTSIDYVGAQPKR